MYRGKPKAVIIRLNFTGKALIVLLLLCNLKALDAQDGIYPPPAGYDSYNTNIPHSTTEIIPYYSGTVGKIRNTRILLPPGYSTDSTYNVLFLLHGIGGDINEWQNNGAPHNILDNLYDKGNVAPMIVVLPNGRAMEDDSPGSDIFAPDKVEGFERFEIELINDLVPFIDSAYPIKPGREAHAIAGLSMGGGQALNFGLAHLDTFAWVGAFSPAPNTKAADSLIPDLAADTGLISALWISCGSADGLIFVAQNTHDFMDENNIDHFYWVEQGRGHDWSVWKPGLYQFAQRIFGNIVVADTASAPDLSAYAPETELPFFYEPAAQAIVLTDYSGIGKLSIYDMNGRLQFTDNALSSNRVDIRSLNRGIYMVIISDGKKNTQGKIVKY